jgi:hypothetical protein
MPKDRMTRGTHWLTGSWRMYVEVDGEASLSSCRTLIEQSLQSTLRKCGFSPEAVTCTMQAVPIKRTTTATYSARKKTPEKNGAQ